MKFHLQSAELFIPDGVPDEEALSRTTHMAIGAHQDDLEIMAFDGILQCFQKLDKWFTGVVVTNGSGSPRSGIYAAFTDEQMQEIRMVEQKKAALIGEYSAQVLLDYPSKAVKNASDKRPVEDMMALLKASSPDIVYTHNLCDKHDTHIGVTLKVIEAIRLLAPNDRPKRLFGCEVWRDLDWMVDTDKIAFNVSEHENLQMALLGVFDSQIAGGKRYDLSTMGRRRAHATYHASHDTDVATGITFGMELTPLIQDVNLDPGDFALNMVDRFRSDVADRIARSR
ncbi:MAG: hypothetical protein AMXMBFR84_05170 [Candidatus Hydrogenedentota bacterium]